MAKMTLEKLAILMNNSFQSLQDYLNLKFGEIEKGRTQLEQGQEDIKLKLDYYAYKFEVVDLKKRVTKVEGRLNHLESSNK
jgi:hypothetical protein